MKAPLPSPGGSQRTWQLPPRVLPAGVIPDAEAFSQARGVRGDGKIDYTPETLQSAVAPAGANSLESQKVPVLPATSLPSGS